MSEDSYTDKKMGPSSRRLSLEARAAILRYKEQDFSTVAIVRLLADKYNIQTTRQSVLGFLKRHETTGSMTDKRKKGLHCEDLKAGRMAESIIGALLWSQSNSRNKVDVIHEQFIDMWMHQNPECPAAELRTRLQTTFGISVSHSYVCMLRRKRLGWKFRKTLKYCQLISHKNKRARLQWCLNMLNTKETFENVIFTDESSIEMSSNGKLKFYHSGSLMECVPNKAPKPKHAFKLHVWAGISYRGRTSICIFGGIMDSVIYQGILKDNFLPWVKEKFPHGYRLYQDNDSKHKSKSTMKWYEENWMLDCLMETPASSPDINPIENLWAAVKDFLQNDVKPTKKDELINGVKTFWERLTPQKCGKYIDHIHKKSTNFEKK